MARYKVYFEHATIVIVEADSEERAKDKAWMKYTDPTFDVRNHHREDRVDIIKLERVVCGGLLP
jgi:hypothetical protein